MTDIFSSGFLYLYWTILLCGKGIGYSSQDDIFRSATWFAMIFVFLKLLSTKWRSQKEIEYCILLNIIGLIVWLCSDDAAILLTTITVTSLKDVNIRNLFVYSFWMKTIFFVIITTMALQGIIDIQPMDRYELGVSVVTRYGLGYGQPNVPQYTLFVITALGIMSYYHKMKWWHYLIMLSYNYFIYTYTNSRTGFVLSECLLICTYLVCKYPRIHETLKRLWLVKYCYIIGFILSLVISGLFASIDFLRSLGTLSSRFGSGADVILSNSINLFGTEDIVTDFGYINIMYSYGIISLICFLLAWTSLIKKIVLNNYVIEALVLVFYSIYTLSEAYTASILMNVSLMLFVLLIYPHTKSGYTIV